MSRSLRACAFRAILLVVIGGCVSSRGQDDDPDHLQTLLGGASFLSLRELWLEDLDGDGDLDLLAARSAGMVYLSENVGGGQFRGPRELGPFPNNIESLADLNGDGQLDLVTDDAWFDLSPFWDAGESPLYGGAVPAGAPRDGLWVDIDRDGDLDLMAAHATLPSLFGFLNDGQGGFDETFTRGEPVYRWLDNTVDFDRDGELDQLGIAADGYLYQKSGGDFQKTEVYIPGFRVASVGDLDGDGDPDLAVEGSNPAGPYVDWLENDGESWQRHPLAVGAGLVGAADWEGDGDVDLIVQMDDGELLLYRGFSDQAVGQMLKVGDGIDSMESVQIGDINADDLPDLLSLDRMNSHWRVSWRAGNGTAAMDMPVTLLEGMSKLREGIATGDLDGDGRIELIRAFNDEILELPTGPGGRPSDMRVLAVLDDGEMVTNLSIDDFNGDGRQDVLGYSRKHAVLLENNGRGTFRKESLEFPDGVALRSLVSFDVNGDGWKDLVFSSFQNAIAYALNDEGEFRPVTAWFEETRSGSLALGDVDGDGEPDLVFVDGLRIVTYLAVTMEGHEGKHERALIRAASEIIRDTGHGTLVDADGDGDLDLLLSHGAGSRSAFNWGDPGYLLLFANEGNGTWADAILLSEDDPPDLSNHWLTLGDIDDDGNVDVVRECLGELFWGPPASLTNVEPSILSLAVTSSNRLKWKVAGARRRLIDGVPRAFAGSMQLEGGQSEVAIDLEGLDGESITRRYAVSADADQDRLPDAWETTYFGDLEADAEDDLDGDGLTNRQEYVLGTDPTDGSSVASRLQIAKREGGVLMLSWDPQPDRAYRMMGFSGTQESESDWLRLSIDSYSTPGRMFVWPDDDERHRLFRLQVSIAPWTPNEIIDEP